MSHYFEFDDKLKNKDYVVNFQFNSVDFNLISNNGVFSKNRLDEGTSILIKALLKNKIEGKILDLGCGYGPIGIVLKTFNPNLEVVYSDVNERCIELTQSNLKKYQFNDEVILSDGLTNINKTFDLITFNPPIRIGKAKIFKIYDESIKHLNNKGKLVIVIRKDKGALSHKEYLSNIYSTSNLLCRDSGYYVYEFIK